MGREGKGKELAMLWQWYGYEQHKAYTPRPELNVISNYRAEFIIYAQRSLRIETSKRLIFPNYQNIITQHASGPSPHSQSSSSA